MSSGSYTVYKADYNPTTSHLNQNPLIDVFDQGNPHYVDGEPMTAYGQFDRIVHASINHLYYRDFITNNKASFGSGAISKQARFLEDQAYVISMPQSRFGESILPGSVSIKLMVSWVDSTQVVHSSTINVTDDSCGNLLPDGYVTAYRYPDILVPLPTGTLPSIAGSWPFAELYKYVDIGPVGITSSYNKGLWCMNTVYNNIEFITPRVGAFNTAYPIDYVTNGLPTDFKMLGAAMHFTRSLNSSVVIQAGVGGKDYIDKNYNFEGGDFAISMVVKSDSYDTGGQIQTLVSKHGPVEGVMVDKLGNIHSEFVPNKTPYRIYLKGDKDVPYVIFERGGGISEESTRLIRVISSISLDQEKLYNISAGKSASIMWLDVATWGFGDDNTTGVPESHSYDDKTISIPDKACANKSDIYIGNNYLNNQGFDGIIDNIIFWNGDLTHDNSWTGTNTIGTEYLYTNLGVSDSRIGSVYYNHGMMVLESIPSRFMTILSVSARGTHTIIENEVSCTIGPGDFNMSLNPTTQEYNPKYQQHVFKPFVTGAYFKPFVTTIGLYNDKGQLLVIGKLSTPIQTPDNTDTTFILRFDR